MNVFVVLRTRLSLARMTSQHQGTEEARGFDCVADHLVTCRHLPGGIRGVATSVYDRFVGNLIGKTRLLKPNAVPGFP